MFLCFCCITLSAAVVSVSNIPQSGVGNASILNASYSFSFKTGLLPARLLSIEYYKIVGQRQVAIYADKNGLPGKLIATSSDGSNQYTAWNNQVFSFPEKPKLQENSRYWVKGFASGGETWGMMGSGASVKNNYGWEIYGEGYNLGGGSVLTTAFLNIKAESEFDGLVGSYPLNGDGVGLVIDSGNTNNFTSQISNTKPAENRLNIENQSVYFNRSSQSRVNVQKGGMQLGVYTMSAWVFPKEVLANSDCTIFSTDKWALSIFNGGLRLTSFGGNTDTQGLVANDKWSHICLIFNGSVVSVYLNGVRVIADFGNPAAFLISRERLLRLGVFDYSSTSAFFSVNYFNGAIDDFRIYGRAFTDVDVLNTYRFNGSDMPGSSGFVWIPAGSFIMASPVSEVDRWTSEIQHQVTISQGFWMSDHEVTQWEYQSLMGVNPSFFAGDINLPVEQINWQEAVNYCAVLTERERGLGKITDQQRYRLPTEAEWEYAARAGSVGSRYGELDAIAWHGKNSENKTHTVKQKQPNAWGLYDMLGNLMEFCSDWYAPYPGGNLIDPKGAAVNSGEGRVVRGGAWGNIEQGRFRSAIRYNLSDPSVRRNHLGFRPVLSTVPVDPPIFEINPQSVTTTSGFDVVLAASAGPAIRRRSSGGGN